MSARFLAVVCAVSLVAGAGRAWAGDVEHGSLGLTVHQLYDPDLASRIGALVVLSVADGMPAAEQGIEKGDLIVAIDGQATMEKPFEELIQKLRGAVGSAVELTLQRFGRQGSVKVTLVRKKAGAP